MRRRDESVGRRILIQDQLGLGRRLRHKPPGLALSAGPIDELVVFVRGAFLSPPALDDPVDTSGPEPRRQAGYTAVPVGAEVIRRVAPLLGLKPVIDPLAPTGVKLSAN